MSPLARPFRTRAFGLLGALTAVVASWTVAAPAAQADDMRSRQWYLDAMKADELWKVSTGKGITVGVLDTGVDSTVSELHGVKVLPGRNFYGEGPGRVDNKDTDRHGTNMAITIAGNGANGGIKGLAPNVTILPVKTGSAVDVGGATAATEGIRYAVDNGARIINMSFGGYRQEDAEIARWQEAVDYALKKGALLFAASGNDGLDTDSYPASAPGVVAVGALDSKGKVTKFSNYGDYVALAAPGDDMPGRCSSDKNTYCETFGTSQATAVASASAALIWSAHPDWTANQVLRVMMETAGHNGPVPSKYIGYGSIRPAQVLLEGKGDPGPPDVNPLLAARSSRSPAPQTSPSPESTGAGDNGQSSQESPSKAPEAAAGSNGGGLPLWAIVASAAAGVVIIGVVVAVSVRSRRA
ncbi:S8 family serine peptidase [Streptomyces marianii]|uniref:Serine protease n=1 Tax=Streptomyces marianii TaxID=1817406 RepID=A0A5R9E0H1_9ACTN|nr:S8 family serine peptidase [Streptomyces marianii]TLQ43360.1 serine protease [Streptomyces marianii]